MLAHPSTDGRSWSRKHRVSCGERMRDPSGPRVRVSASSVALRSTRRASATRQTGGTAQGGLERRRHAGFLCEFSSLLTAREHANRHDNGCLPPGELHSPGHCIHSMDHEHKEK